MKHRRTKIICTMGPAVNTPEKISALIDAGMNVARLNFSHGTQEEHKKVIDLLKAAREAKKVPLAIMLDTKGPEIRVGNLKNDSITLTTGQKVMLVKQEMEGTSEKIPIHPAVAIESMPVGHQILFDDGNLTAKVLEKRPEGVLVEFLNGGVLKTHKGVNIPGVDVNLPAMTAQDVSDLTFGCQHGVDLIAASFIRSADHVREIKQLLAQQGGSAIEVIAKIENRLGVKNFDSIVQVADGIMVARGDLGVELPIKEVPILQKMMIRKCLQASKPVVTATQMLESMIKNPRPTRAEASDVANAIYDSTSAVMLSGETAVGQYPVETVEMMRSIVEEAEKDFNYREFFNHHFDQDSHDISSSISMASVRTAYNAGAKAIFAFTSSGFTAKLVARYRPEMPIFALASKMQTYHQLALNWGVIPVPPQACKNVPEAFASTSRFAESKKFLEEGDLVVLTAGSPFGVSGTTNMMMVQSVGDVILRAHPGHGEKVEGEVAILLSKGDWKSDHIAGKVVVISRCAESDLPLLKAAKAIILQNDHDDQESEKQAEALAKKTGVALLIRADYASSRLAEKQQVLVDPVKGVVFKCVLLLSGFAPLFVNLLDGHT